jgi:hypothetical protein
LKAGLRRPPDVASIVEQPCELGDYLLVIYVTG